MSGLGTCRDCGEWIYWGQVETEFGTKNVPYSDSNQTTMHWEDCANQDYVTDRLGNMYRVQKCKDCGHSVYWETTARGRKRPMDVFADEDTGEFTPAGECHFETCVGQATGGNWRQQDFDDKKRKQEADSRKADRERAGAQREEIHDWEIKRLEPWLKDLKLTWPCTQVDVTSAFRKQALETHPDMGGSDRAFIKIKVAYDQLRKLMFV